MTGIVKYMKLVSAAVIFLAGSLQCLVAQNRVEKQHGTFHYEQSVSKDVLRQNIDSLVSAYRLWGMGVPVMVTGSASPEGTGKWLAPLARKRALRLRTGLIESGFPDSMIVLGR